MEGGARRSLAKLCKEARIERFATLRNAALFRLGGRWRPPIETVEIVDDIKVWLRQNPFVEVALHIMGVALRRESARVGYSFSLLAPLRTRVYIRAHKRARERRVHHFAR